MTDEEFAQIMGLSRELRGVEFIGPGPLSNGRLVAQVVKGVLSMDYLVIWPPDWWNCAASV